MNPNQLAELCDHTGYVRASDEGLCKMYWSRKDVVKIVDEANLCDNRIDHNVAVVANHGEEHIIVCVQSDRKEN